MDCNVSPKYFLESPAKLHSPFTGCHIVYFVIKVKYVKEYKADSMLDKVLIADLKLVHGSYNSVMMLLFLYQGSLGLRIRKERKTGNKPLLNVIKRHRHIGPVLAPLGVLGFFAGGTLALLDYGGLLKNTLHFIIGLLLACSIITTFFVSKQIRGPESPSRNLHFRLGIFILCLYPIQVFLGLGIFF